MMQLLQFLNATVEGDVPLIYSLLADPLQGVAASCASLSHTQLVNPLPGYSKGRAVSTPVSPMVLQKAFHVSINHATGRCSNETPNVSKSFLLIHQKCNTDVYLTVQYIYVFLKFVVKFIYISSSDSKVYVKYRFMEHICVGLA